MSDVLPVKIEGNRFLVTGGAGFVGSHIVEQLTAEGATEIRVLDNLARVAERTITQLKAHESVQVIRADIRDREAVRKATDGVDYVFHQAAMWLRECEQNPRESLDVNIIGTFNVAEAACDLGVRKLVAASSSSVYGDGLHLPTDEDHPFNNDLFYGAGKVAGEQLYRCFRKARGLSYVALRYLNVYGPRQSMGSAYMDVIANFADRIEVGEPPRIEGDGSATLDMVYVADVARANILALTSPIEGEAFNVCSGKETSVGELAEIMLRLYGREDLKPEYVPRDASLVSRRWGSPNKAREMLGFEPRISIEEGLRRVIEARTAQAASSV